MSNPTLYEYGVYCNTDGYVSSDSGHPIFGYSDPTTCPINNSHTISAVSLIRVVESSEIKIREEDIPTQGYMEVVGYTFDIPAGNTGDITKIEIPMEDDINVYEVNLLCEPENEHDTFDMYVLPTSPIGYITQSISIGDSYVYLNSTAMLYYKRGFTVAVQDGANVVAVGRILELDNTNSRVKLRHNSTVSITASPTTVVYLWITRGTNVPFLSQGCLTMGNGKIGGSFVSKGLVVYVFYKNNTGLAKKFKLAIEETY